MGFLLDQVADARLHLERSRPSANPASFRLMDPLLRLNGKFDLSAATATVRMFRLKNVVLDAREALLLKQGTVISDTCYFVGEDYQAEYDPADVIRLPEAYDYILGFNKMVSAYHHWLIQCLPAIDWGLRLRRDRPAVLVLPKLAAWQEDMIALLNHQGVQRLTVEEGKFYAFPQLDYADYLSGRISFGVTRTVYETARRMLDHVPAGTASSQIVYVPCSIPHYGHIANEAEVLACLRRWGVTILDSSLDTAAKLDLFRNADVVIGPHGTDLANILFTRPGALLWEWSPRHYQNTVFNRLAQTAQVDYWGDVFDSEDGPHYPKAWYVDVEVLKQRLAEILGRLAHRESFEYQPPTYAAVQPRGKPVDDLMLAFESLGDNCDFGLIQRHAGVEPLGIFRFTGILFDQLLAALDSEFEGVGDPENMKVTILGEGAEREYMVSERSIGGYHTFIMAHEMDRETLRRRQARRLVFLRRKIIDDLKSAEKIWVWRESEPSAPERIVRLLAALRRYGPNRLLWVTVAAGAKPPGTVERLGPDLVRGYATPFGADRTAPGQVWFQVCEAAYYLWHPEERDVEHDTDWR